MKTSLVQLKAQLKLIQEDHLFLNSFFWGDLHRAYGEGGAANGTDEVQYPIMCCYEAPSGGNMARLLTGVSLIIVVADKTFKDYTSLDDTTSDTLQCCRDIHNTLKRSPRWRQILTVRTASVSRFIDKGDDMITGHILQMQVDLKDSESYCNLPMTDYDFGSQPSPDADCLSGTAINSTATYSLSVPSGGVSQLPDITHTDSDGSPVTLPAQTAFVATSCVSSAIIYRPPMPSGVWSIYRTFDEGWHVQNGTFNYDPTDGVYVDLDKTSSNYYTTLLDDNVFGNRKRFTNDIGGDVTDGTDGSTSNYVIDHYTGLGWGTVARGPFNWNGVIDDAASVSIGPYNDFRAPSQPSGESISNPQLSAVFNYAPFLLTTATRTSTTPSISTGRAYTLASNGDISFPTKSTAANYIPVRNHFV